MPRETFQKELDRLVEDVVGSAGVESCLETMVEACREDVEIAKRRIGVDSRFKERGAEIDEE